MDGHLKSLERRHLAPDQWEHVSGRAVMRFARFQSIAELYDMTREAKLQAEIRANSEWRSSLRGEWEHEHGEEEPDDSTCSGLQGP
jgi:hypothetical protein